MQTRDVSVKEEEEEEQGSGETAEQGLFWKAHWCHMIFSELFQCINMLKCEKEFETPKIAFFSEHLQ